VTGVCCSLPTAEKKIKEKIKKKKELKEKQRKI